MRGGSLEEFTRGLFFVDESRVWVSPELGGKRRKGFTTEVTEVHRVHREERRGPEALDRKNHLSQKARKVGHPSGLRVNPQVQLLSGVGWIEERGPFAGSG